VSAVVLKRRECDEDEDLLVGEYRQVTDVRGIGRVLWATTRCPECRQVWSIGKRNHTVDVNGNVSPSLVCAGAQIERYKCTWHVFVRLDGWKP
jgi:hypothetical protein